MTTLHDTIRIAHGACPPSCSACADACARHWNDTHGSRIEAVHLPELEFHGAFTCVQCARPRCAEVCPTEAIVKSPVDGTVSIDEARCVGCALCTLACSYGGVYYDSQARKAYSCDKCGGDPQCVAACSHGVLSHVDYRPILSREREPLTLTYGEGNCLGCPMELAFRHMIRVLGHDTILFAAPGCSVNLSGSAPGMAAQMVLMTNVASAMSGAKRYLKKKGKETKCVAFVGDGVTVDVGFQPLSGAAERGENLIYICVDNEAYMATGIQRSGSTSFRAWTYTTPVGERQMGKSRPAKNVPLLMAFHGVPYSATATTGYLDDFLQKVEKAAQVKDGLAYIHLLSPCPTGWRFPSDSTLEVSRTAVDTNYFPLWEFDHGRFRITHEVKNPKPIGELTRLMRRYAHLKGAPLQELQESVDERYAQLLELCRLGRRDGGAGSV